jgi:hypothetical protein
MTVTPHLLAHWTDVPTAASMTATLELDGATLATATQSRNCNFSGCTDTGDLSVPLTAQVTIPEGQAFEFSAGLSGSASGNIDYPASAGADAVFAFDGLPPGIGIVTCHDAPTPALRGTWGALKLRYR